MVPQGPLSASWWVRPRSRDPRSGARPLAGRVLSLDLWQWASATLALVLAPWYAGGQGQVPGGDCGLRVSSGSWAAGGWGCALPD